MSDPVVVWEPQVQQAKFITCPADDVGFGGARGGGKSDGLIGDHINHSNLYGQHAIGLCIRRQRTELLELMERFKQVCTPLGFKWYEQDKVLKSPQGGRLRFSYLESDGDADAYQGHSYTRVYVEEAGTFPNEAPVNKLMATLRSGNGVPCQLKATTNPGGPGHQWVKARYNLSGRPTTPIIQHYEFINPFTKRKIPKVRVFIPSKVVDNKYLGDDYVANLYQTGSEQLVDAWVHGDWDVIQGAFFDCWNYERHVLTPFEIPAHWLRFRSGDWGSAKPASIGWWAVAGDDFDNGRGRIVPRGALVRYREWYVASGPNTGLKLTAEQVALGILEREPPEERALIKYSVLDPAAFANDGGPSIAERMATETKGKISWVRADNKRVSRKGAMGGWDQMRQRLVGDEQGRPMAYCFNTCKDSIRTIPALQHDPDNPEDLDTDGEDHAGDEWRYACMSRPWIPKQKAEVEKPKYAYTAETGSEGRPKIATGMTWNEMMKRHVASRNFHRKFG